MNVAKIRSRVMSALVLAGALLAAAHTASAQTGVTAKIYEARVYYYYSGQWRHYGTYHVAVYSRGGTNWGGCDRACSYLASRGLRVKRTYRYVRTTSNGDRDRGGAALGTVKSRLSYSDFSHGENWKAGMLITNTRTGARYIKWGIAGGANNIHDYQRWVNQWGPQIGKVYSFERNTQLVWKRNR